MQAIRYQALGSQSCNPVFTEEAEMRLVNTTTLKLSLFTDNRLPQYAILSHTWGDEEISSEEMILMTPQVKAKSGFEKIRKCCELAVKDRLDYAWIDTCCINKSSSAELSEAINSMYKWYKQAQICYVILSDVPRALAFRKKDPLFNRSRWFTRGWTLQELLAPAKLRFFSVEWQAIGRKQDLAQRISAVTGISPDILQDERDLQTLSIAHRMSWAASRNTTRIEDTAYCLMGIFDINMPMLYGEGEKAFIRLQEEILKSAEDHSIFAWADPEVSDEELCGLLAPHPRCFRTSGKFHPFSTSGSEGELITVTNRGISLNARLHGLESSGLTAMFDCTESNHVGSFAFIYLLPLAEAGSKFARVRANTLGRAPRRGTSKPIILKQNPKRPVAPKILDGQQWFMIKSIKLPSRDVLGGETVPFFTVAKDSAIRAYERISTTTFIADGESAQIHEPVSKYLLKVPNQPKRIAVTLHLTAQDTSGFPIWYHAKLQIGTSTGGRFAIAATYLGEGDKEYDKEQAGGTGAFQQAVDIPATLGFQMEQTMTVSAKLAWETIKDETIPCISLNVVAKVR